MSRAQLRILTFASACVLAACSGDERKRTQIVVVVTSNLHVPDELDEVRVQARATRAGAEPSPTARGVLGSDGLELPVSVTLEPASGSLDPIEVTASGYLDGTRIVEQTRRLSFARAKSVILRLELSRRCTGSDAPKCDSDETCVAGECAGRFIDVDTLDVFTGFGSLGPDGGAGTSGRPDGAVDVPLDDAGNPIDAGSGSGGSGAGLDGGPSGSGGTGGSDAAIDGGSLEPCQPSAEICNGADEDCDNEIDEDFDFGSLVHCGSCGNACPESPPFAASVCTTGTCRLVCAPGTADCDDMLSTGCERRLSDTATCGDCDTQCTGGTPFCAQEGDTAMCVGACGAPTPDECGDSCVDTETDIFHCNNCGNACAGAPNGTPVCSSGNCGFTCPGTLQDCDGMSGNGCETNTASDVDNCGGCAAANVCPTRAHSTRTCVNGVCGIACAPGWGNCDNMPANGCETNTFNNDSHCGACNNRCTGSQVCCGTRCGILSLLGGVCL